MNAVVEMKSGKEERYEDVKIDMAHSAGHILITKANGDPLVILAGGEWKAIRMEHQPALTIRGDG